MAKRVLLLLLLVVIGLGCAYYGFYWHHNSDYRIHDSAADHQATRKHDFKPAEPHVIKVLALSGGGSKGLITVQLLIKLEQITHKPISKLFDMVVGTSTGALIGASLLEPAKGSKTQNAYTSLEVRKLYLDLIPKVFHSSTFRKVSTINGIIGPKYSSKERHQALTEIFGKIRFSQLLKPMLIPTYSLNHAKVKLYRSWDKDSRNYYLTSLLMAATAAPVIFPPVTIYDHKIKQGETLVDGAIFANNPTLIALASLMKTYPHAHYIVVHVGTGYYAPHLKYENAKNWGFLRWIKNFVPVLIYAGNSRVKTLTEMLAVNSKIPSIRYYNFDVALPKSMIGPDLHSPENMKKLQQYGDKMVQENKSKLKYLASILAAKLPE